MANELQLPPGIAPTGSTVYALVFGATGQAWNGSAFATFTATRGDFDLPLTEVSGTGLFLANMPGTAGQRRWQYWLQVGGSPSASADVLLGSGYGWWDGTKLVVYATTGDGAAIAAASQINPVRIVSANPVASDLNITLREGDDYSTSDAGRALEWAITDADLSAGTGVFKYIAQSHYAADTDSFTSVGTVSITYSSGVNTVKVALTAAETAAMTLTTPPEDKHAYYYEIDVTLSGRIRTVASGGMTVVRGA